MKSDSITQRVLVFGVYLYCSGRPLFYVEVCARGPQHAAELALSKCRAKRAERIRVVALD
jgi:hypothetical protein